MPDDAENKREMEEPGCGPAPPADQQGDAPAEEQDWDVAKRILAFAAAAVMVYASVWLGCDAVRYAGPLLVGLAMLLAAAVLLGAGLAMTAMGLLGVPTRQASGDGGQPLGRETERRGLPTDPEAYQGGGLAVAIMLPYLEEAEVAASVLKCAGIPAWVDGVHMASWYWHYQFAVHPGGIRVLVPAGRLTDAEAALNPDAMTLPDWLTEEPLETEADAIGYGLLRSARRSAFLSFTWFFWPVALVWACIVLARAYRQRKAAGSSAYFQKARRIALFVIVYIGLFAGLVVVGLTAVWLGELL